MGRIRRSTCPGSPPLRGRSARVRCRFAAIPGARRIGFETRHRPRGARLETLEGAGFETQQMTYRGKEAAGSSNPLRNPRGVGDGEVPSGAPHTEMEQVIEVKHHHQCAWRPGPHSPMPAQRHQAMQGQQALPVHSAIVNPAGGHLDHVSLAHERVRPEDAADSPVRGLENAGTRAAVNGEACRSQRVQIPLDIVSSATVVPAAGTEGQPARDPTTGIRKQVLMSRPNGSQPFAQVKVMAIHRVVKQALAFPVVGERIRRLLSHEPLASRRWIEYEMVVGVEQRSGIVEPSHSREEIARCLFAGCQDPDRILYSQEETKVQPGSLRTGRPIMHGVQPERQHLRRDRFEIHGQQVRARDREWAAAQAILLEVRPGRPTHQSRPRANRRFGASRR